MEFNHYDIIALTETFLSEDNSDESLQMQGYYSCIALSGVIETDTVVEYAFT